MMMHERTRSQNVTHVCKQHEQKHGRSVLIVADAAQRASDGAHAVARAQEARA
jgi:hypothetical protein